MCSDIKDQSGSSESVANPSEASVSVSQEVKGP